MENKKKILRKSKARQRDTTCRAYLSKDGDVPGFCPVCSKPVGIIMSENARHVFGMCPECGNTLFYADKKHNVDMDLGFEFSLREDVEEQR